MEYSVEVKIKVSALSMADAVARVEKALMDAKRNHLDRLYVAEVLRVEEEKRR